MEYHGKLYGRLGRDFYFDTGKTSEDYDNLVKRVAELEAQLEQKLNIHGVVRGGDKVHESVKRVEEYLEWLKGNDTPNTPTELLATEAQDTVAARGACEHECTGPWDCQCQDVIDAFYRGVERKSSEGQL